MFILIREDDHVRKTYGGNCKNCNWLGSDKSYNSTYYNTPQNLAK